MDDFYSIIRSVHITERGVHVGQKKTYRAVSYLVFYNTFSLHEFCCCNAADVISRVFHIPDVVKYPFSLYDSKLGQFSNSSQMETSILKLRSQTSRSNSHVFVLRISSRAIITSKNTLEQRMNLF